MSTDETPTPAADLTHPGGMRALRVMPTEVRQHLDPFVLFERFHIEPHQGFDAHPHYGFEIVSYMLEGGMDHEDSMGHASTANPGDAMRITTGSGMRHAELPADDAFCSGLQLWVNLPRDRKAADPGYEDVEAEGLPREHRDGAAVTTVVGEGSPIDLYTDLEYLDARIEDEWTWTIPEEWTGFLYAIDGRGKADGDSVETAEYLVREDGGRVQLESNEELRVAAIAGEPHDEPIRHNGPFVE